MKNRDSGFSFVDLTLVVVILALVAGSVVPTYTSRIRDKRATALAADAIRFYDALVRFKEDTGHFPATFAPADRALDRGTLAPLSDGGYLDNVQGFVEQLKAYRVTVYFSPTIEEANEKFWSILIHDDDPTILLLVAHTDSFTMNPGEWYDGVYSISGNEIVPISEAKT